MGEATGSPIRDERGPRPGGHPVFALLYDVLNGAGERRIVGPERRRLVDACRGRVLELGIGTGASLPYWREAHRRGSCTSLVAVEPDPSMRRRAVRRAARLGLHVEILPASAEALPLPDASCDAVAAFLVLCTVGDPARALAEAYRVLRPGGTFAFLEHVRAEGPAARWQTRLRPVWSRLAAGCQLDRDTAAAITAAGFRDLHFRSRPLPFPLCRLIAGTARRPDAEDPPPVVGSSLATASPGAPARQ
jgi:SAM-dependent methyltransferase